MTETAVNTAFTKELMASNASAGLARSLVASHLLKWKAAQFIDRAIPVVGELFNNAVSASGVAENIYIHARLNGSILWVGVSDSSPDEPHRRRTIQGLEDLDSWEEKDLRGWGLGIVEAFSDRVWTESARYGLKWVCAEFRDREGGRWSIAP